MVAKIPIRTVFDGSTATGLAEFQSGEFIDLAQGGIGASLSIGSAGQVLKVNSGASALEFGSAAIAGAQTTITSIFATDLILGEDTQTAIDFGTANEIDFKVDNAARLTLTASALHPVTDDQIDLGTASLEFKNAFFDGTVTSYAFAGPLTGAVTGDVTGNADTATALATARTIGGTSFDGSANIAVGLAATATALASARTIGGTSFDGTANIAVGLATLATTVTVTDNEDTNENNVLVFVAGADADGGNVGLESDGHLIYNPSTGTLSVPNIVVSGTQTIADTVTMQAENAIVFEGATADLHETTLTIVDPTADRTINLPNQSGTVPVLAAASNTAVTSTPEELNALDGITAVVGELNALDIGSTAVGTAVASKAVILDSSKDYTGIRNLTISGEIDAATGDYSGAVDIAGATTVVALTASGLVTAGAKIDMNGTELILDADADTSITADTDDQIDIRIAGADDFTFTANTFTAVSGSTIAAQALTATTITASGIVKTDDATDATSTTDGSLQTDGGLSVVKDAILGNDVTLISDAAVLKFGVNAEVTLTHVHDTGLLLNSTNVIQFNDASQNIGAPSNAILDINATDEIELNATLVDVNANLDVSGTIVSGGVITGTAFTAGSAVLAEAELELLDGLTAGTAIASKVVTTDASIDTTGQRNLTISGELDAATLDISGAIDVAGNSVLASVDVTGVATAATFEPDGDTAAGDNAAIGYTSVLGLILTGEGSTNDVTIVNDADTTVMGVATGTTTVNFAGQLNGGTIILAETDTDTSNTGSITIDFSTHQNFVLTLTGSVTLANPSTETVGQAGVFVFIQDGTGSRTLSLGTDYESPAGGGITLSTAANAVDVVPYFVKAANSIQLGAPQLAFS